MEESIARVEVEEKHRYVSAAFIESIATTHWTVLQVFLSIFKEGRGGERYKKRRLVGEHV